MDSELESGQAERLSEIEKRLVALQNENRRLRSLLYVVPCIGLLASMVLAFVVALGVGTGVRMWPHDVLRARTIILRDREHHTSIFIGPNRKGTTGLSILGKGGKRHMTLAVSGMTGDPFLAMNGRNGTSGVNIGTHGNSPGLVLAGTRGVPRAVLSLGDKQMPHLWFNDDSGKTRLLLELAGEDRGGLVLYRDSGRFGTAVGLLEDGPGLSIWDKNDKLIRRIR